MAVWRCPHCATPQPESSRCWVCRRSTTSCATCRHFRKGVAGGLGLCGLDPRREALDGTEMRPCWIAEPAAPDPAERRLVPVGPGRASGREPAIGTAAGRQPRTFVPVEPSSPVPEEPQAASGVTGTTDAAVARAAAISPATGRPGRIPGSWWLWGDPEPWPDL
jgi:hypothetical protein